jgi:clan AA aspartic protease
MIQGVVNADLEATLPIEIIDSRGNVLQVRAVIDTGYNGSLSLPLSLVRSLGLVPLLSSEVRLADLTTKTYDFYSGEVAWDRHRRNVRVLCLEGDPLIGTALLEDCKLEAIFKAGGAVTVTPSP